MTRDEALTKAQAAANHYQVRFAVFYRVGDSTEHYIAKDHEGFPDDWVVIGLADPDAIPEQDPDEHQIDARMAEAAIDVAIIKGGWATQPMKFPSVEAISHDGITKVMQEMKGNSFTYGEAENIAAISSALFSAFAFEEFMSNYNARYEGCKGVYQLVMQAAKQLEKVATATGQGWDEWDWYVSCDTVAAFILEHAPRWVSEADIATCLRH